MSKTASMATMAIKWMKGEEELKHFDFVFLIRLGFVDKTSTLAELVIRQHDRLRVMEIPAQKIETILKGKTKPKYKVLLILDGYDEYKPGTNKEVDEAIDLTVGYCFLILTSRPEFLKTDIRNKMKRIATIKGFSDDNIERFCSTFLQSDVKGLEMLQQANQSELYELLRIPIILLLSCIVYSEKNKLPRTKTDIYETIFDIMIDRTAYKNFSPGLHADLKFMIDPILDALGEAAWAALQNDESQLILIKVSSH